MKAAYKAARRGFTLVELLVAMAVTALLVTIIMQLTTEGLSLWRSVQQDVNTSARARVALRTIAHDLESFQMRGGNRYQWFSSKVDTANNNSQVADKLEIPHSVRTVFFACAPDRNPAVSSNGALRAAYRTARDSTPETQGDVNTIAYRLVYRDHILGKAAGGKDDGSFPVFALNRHVVSPRGTYDDFLCRSGGKGLMGAYDGKYKFDDKNFLCENILEMTMVFNIEYTESADKNGKAETKTVSVPVISSRGGNKELNVYGDHIMVGGKTYKNARIVSANISMTVLTEDGANLVEQIRKGRRRAPNREAFLANYTRSFSRTVMLPQPL